RRRCARFGRRRVGRHVLPVRIVRVAPLRGGGLAWQGALLGRCPGHLLGVLLLLLGLGLALVGLALLPLLAFLGVALGGLLLDRLLLGLLAALGRQDRADLGVAHRIAGRQAAVVLAGGRRQRAGRGTLPVDAGAGVLRLGRLVAEQPATARQERQARYGEQA